MNIIKILDIERHKKKLSYSELAKMLGISRQNLNYHLKNLKNNKISFSVDQVKKICKILKIDVSIFFTD